jgi:spermidine synthase
MSRESSPPLPPPLTRTLPALYVASGMAALILEVSWSRLLTLQFGHTTGASSTVLAAFMGGLAVGSGLGGRLAERHDRRGALRLYAVLELIVAVSALTLPFVIAAARPLLEWAYADGSMVWRFGIARIAASLFALAIPTIAMGATYPVATRALAPERHHTEHAAGWLYTANTLGAATGALLAGFLLLPTLGIWLTTLTAVALNLTAAALAWRLSAGDAAERAMEGHLRSGRPSEPHPATPAHDTAQHADERLAPPRSASHHVASAAVAAASGVARAQPEAVREHAGASREAARGSRRGRKGRNSRGAEAAVGGTHERRRRSSGLPSAARFGVGGAHALWIGLLAAATSGLVALVNQVVWTRVLALIVGPTTFAFSAMVGVFITGLAVGAAIGTRLARGRRAGLWLGAMGLAGAMAMTVAMQVTGRLLLWMATAAAPTTAFDAVVWRELAVAAALLLPLSITFGAAFPLALAVVGGEGLTSTRLSWTYAANTTGAIAGALMAGFVLIPIVGLQTTLQLGALASVGVSLLVLLTLATASWRGRAVAAGVAVLVGAGVLTRGVWDPALLSSGAYRFAPAVTPDELEAVLTAGDMLFYREGPAGTVAVRRLAGTTSLVIDGKPDASNAGDMLTQKLLAHLPLLLHPSPKRVCVLGLGTGVTAGAALTHPVSHLDVVEISEAVSQASQFFRAENRDALADPRARLLVADGRSHLRLTDAQYDVVISEPSNPWMAGVAALFTREFMTAVRERLAPGGIFCQWTHTYDMSKADLQSIAATFLGVFPHASLWLVGESDVLLIGSLSPLPTDAATLAARFARPGVAGDLRGVDVSRIDDLLGLRIAGTDALRAYAAGADPQTDDRMALEFSAPRSLAARTGRENVTEILALSSPQTRAVTLTTADQWLSRARMLLRAEAHDLAFDALAHALTLRPAEESAFEPFARAAAGAAKMDAAIAQLRTLLGADATNVPARAALARLLMARGDAPGAIAAIEAAGANAISDPRLQRELASIYADLGDADRLAPIVARLERDAAQAPDTQYFAASLAFLQGNFDDALRRAQTLIAAHPEHARAQNLIGAALATQGQVEAARAAFARSIAADPRDSGTYINAGSLELEHGRPDDARRQFAIALATDISSDAARRGLAAAREALGRP